MAARGNAPRWKRMPKMPRPDSLVRATALAAALLAAPVAAESVFFDSFEVGSVCAWSSAAGAPACCGALILEENFALADGSAWPAPWVEAGNEVALADVQGGRGRLRPAPSGYSLARMVAPGTAAVVEALFTLVFEDAATQGVGFYARQNGGYLQQTVPPGEGYAVFVEAFRGDAIGVWREVDGVEDDLEILFDPGLGFVDDTPYRVRYRMDSVPGMDFVPGMDLIPGLAGRPMGATTRLRARVWPAGAPEPAIWQVDFEDSSPELQGDAAGFAIDSWSELTAAIGAHTLVDDLQVFEVCSE